MGPLRGKGSVSYPLSVSERGPGGEVGTPSPLTERGPGGEVGPRGPAVVLDEHNAEYVLQARAWRIALRSGHLAGAAYSLLQAWKLRRYEAASLRQVDGVVAVSEADRRALAALGPLPPCAVVPNGVDTDRYQPLPSRPAGSPRLVFTGTMSFRPNVDAVEWFVRTVWPALRRAEPNLSVAIVGREPTPAVRALGRIAGVEVVGPVPDDRPPIGSATVYIVPLRIGGGVRLKILQAMAMGVPIVSTTLGYEGIDASSGEHLLAADTPDEFAAAIRRVLHDPALAQSLGASGRALAAAHYDWRQLVPGIEQLYEEAASRRRSVNWE
ncbi:MAG: glycosyltransferase [Chloroflexi bacterium]|nr:glycosyltransferase [Chloroflexota bacterium]